MDEIDIELIEKHCEDCGTVLNPATKFHKCYFCYTGEKRPEYSRGE